MNERGFTLIEMVVSVTIASIIASVLMAISFTMFGSVLRARITAELAIESQALLRAIVEDARLAGSLSTTNQISDPHAPAGGWQTNDPSNILIIDSPAIDANRDIIYNPATTLPYDNEVVYFGSGTRLFRRTLPDPTAPGNRGVRSCPTALASSSCPADKLMTQYLRDLSFVFYDEDDQSTANADLARSVQITVILERRVSGTPVRFNNTIRATLRNR